MVFRDVAAGFAGAVLTVIFWVGAALVFPIASAIVASRLDGTGAGGAGAIVGSGSLAVAAIVGFAAGYYLSARRTR